MLLSALGDDDGDDDDADDNDDDGYDNYDDWLQELFFVLFRSSLETRASMRAPGETRVFMIILMNGMKADGSG